MEHDMTLQQDWAANKRRPAWIQANRQALMAATGCDIPRSRSAIDAWLDDHMAVITRKLGADAEADDADADVAEADTDTDTETDS